MHVLCCFSCFGHHLLQEHDTVLREGLSAIHISDIQQLQACTRVKSGGLGIQRALTAFLASTVATSDLQSAILSLGVQNVDKEVELTRFLWCSLTTTSTPVGSLQVSQRDWNAPMVMRNFQALLDNAMSNIDRARLLTEKADHGS